MEKTILTTSQRKLLEIISKDEFITSQFFLTGGTALSQFYFKHRISEDLDFFSEKEFDSKRLLTVISSTSKNLKTTKLQQQSLTGQEVFFLHFSNEMVKIDFSYFPFHHLGTFQKFNKLKISSVEDICINKVHAITTRRRARDYLDLYFCMEYLNWQAEDLRKNYKLKFDVDLAPEQLATSFTNVIDAQDLPVFLGKTPWGKIKDYFLHQTTLLKSKIVK